MAFDGIVTKAIAQELQSLTGGRIDKVYQPSKNNIILSCYLNGKNYALNICIDSKYGRIHLTTHAKPNPQVAPNFCMLLRKHLIGLRLKNVITSNLERVVTLEFEGFDDVDDVVIKKLVVELMGKHGNIILLDENRVIIDSLRHTTNKSDSYRNVYPHEKYIFPTSCKFNFLDTLSYETFKSKLALEDSKNSNALKNKPIDITCENFVDTISNQFNGISKSFAKSVLDVLKIKEINDFTLLKIYNYIVKIIENIGTNNLAFENILDSDKNVKDYYLTLRRSNDLFNLNFFIDDYYYTKESSEEFKSFRNSTLKLILNVLKKYNSRLLNIDKKLQECENMELYKLYGELITANLYKIKNENLEEIELENYYDNNKKIVIPLDKKYVPSINAKRFFKKYNKLKNTLEIVSKQKQDTLQELNYLESIVYELENSKTTQDVAEIFDEISENVLFQDIIKKKNKNSKIKKTKFTKNKEVLFNPIKYTIDGFTILVGRNNKENDYLTLKYANKQDLWFHTKDIHGSHVILKASSLPINDEILTKCAMIATKHSKAKLSTNVPVDYCLVKYVKKPSNSKPRYGYIFK